jgi:hypothetical protein
MKRTATILIILFVSALNITAQVNEEEKTVDKAERAVRNTDDFSMEYFQKKENQHFVMIAEVIEGKVSRAMPEMELRPGNIQKRYTSGNFKVTWLDREGKELGSYRMEDPTTVRTWEDPEIKKIDQRKFEIVLPKDPRIATVVISRDEEVINRWNISERVKRLMDNQ